MADPNLRKTPVGSFIDLQKHANGDEIVSQDYYQFQSEPLSTSNPDYLGSGGFGAVFQAQCVRTKEMVALKRSDVPHFKGQKQVFKQEWQANLRLKDTSHITRFLNLIVTDKYIYLVFELMGPDLFEAISARGSNYFGGMTEDQARDATRSILLGLRHLHVDLDLIHRDIKPENLLLPINHSGNFHGLKIADLGFCTNPDNVTSFLGTHAYCAPEHLPRGPRGSSRRRAHPASILAGRAEDRVQRKVPNHTPNESLACKASDLWSVGVCLFAMLCGYHPFTVTSTESLGSKKSDRLRLLFLKIKNQNVVMTDEVWQGRSDECKDLVKQLLSKKHIDRPTCDQALEHPWFKDLEAAARSRDSPNQMLTLKKVGKNMRKLNARRKFERGVRVLVNTNMWREYLQSIRKRRTELHLGSSELMVIVSPFSSSSSSSSSSSFSSRRRGSSAPSTSLRKTGCPSARTSTYFFNPLLR